MAVITALRATAPAGPVTIAITSGKGGVGKTSVVVNLAVALARMHRRVAVLDADFGLGNVDVLLGLAPSAHVGDVIEGGKDMRDIVVKGPQGILVIPAGSGLRELTALGAGQWQRLSAGLAHLGRDLDFLLIDTAAGISDNVVDLLVASERVLLVTSNDPGAIVDAYAMVKVLGQSAPGHDIGLIVNGARDSHEAQGVHRQLDAAVSRFLGRRLGYVGYVAWDAGMRDAVLRQRAVVDHLPHSPASRCFRVLATRLAGLTPSGGPGLRLVAPLPMTAFPHVHTEVPRCA